MNGEERGHAVGEAPRPSPVVIEQHPSGLSALRPGYELALIDRDNSDQPILGYWKVKAVHDGGIEVWDEHRDKRLWLVVDEYSAAKQNQAAEPHDDVV